MYCAPQQWRRLVTVLVSTEVVLCCKENWDWEEGFEYMVRGVPARMFNEDEPQKVSSEFSQEWHGFCVVLGCLEQTVIEVM